MKLYINKDLIQFFKIFVSSYNVAVQCRKDYFQVVYFKGICEIVLPYLLKTRVIRNFKINGNLCNIYLGYNNFGLIKKKKAQLFCFKKQFYKINYATFLKNFKDSNYFFNFDCYFIYNNQFYNLKELKLLKISKKNSIYVIFKLIY